MSVLHNLRKNKFCHSMKSFLIPQIPFQVGDTLEVLSTELGETPDTETIKVNLIVRNNRTEDQENLCIDHVLFDPEWTNFVTVYELAAFLHLDTQGPKYNEKLTKMYEILTEAGVIDRFEDPNIYEKENNNATIHAKSRKNIKATDLGDSSKGE